MQKIMAKPKPREGNSIKSRDVNRGHRGISKQTDLNRLTDDIY